MALLQVFHIISIILALAATILAFIFILPDKKRSRLNFLGKFVHDLCNFKFLVIEKILQFVYVTMTAYCILYGFLSIFTFYDTWGGVRWAGQGGFLIMLLGPIVVRIAFELIMMAILAVKNIVQINNKLKNQNGTDGDSAFGSLNLKEYAPAKNAQRAVPPQYAQQQYAQQQYAQQQYAQQQYAQQQYAQQQYAQQQAAQQQPARPTYTSFCTKCGKPMGPDGVCHNPNCGQ